MNLTAEIVSSNGQHTIDFQQHFIQRLSDT